MLNNIHDLLLVSKEEEGKDLYHEVLEYIELDGTQYFDLGFKSDLGTGYEIGVQFNDLGASGCGVCGSRDNSSASENNIGMFVGSSTSVVQDYNNSSYTGSRYTVPKADLNTTDWYDAYNYRTSRGIRKNGVEVGTPNTTTATTAFTMQNNFYLGGYNGFNLTPFKGKIRYFKCVSPEMDIIPVLDSQMRPCFYDRISKKFYYHSNSTGSTVPTYKRWNKFDVDYIENPSTAYIPFADITPTTTMGMNIEYAYTTLSTTEPAGVIGTYNGDTQRKDTFFVSTSSGYTQKASGSTCGVMVFHRGGNIGTSTATQPTYLEPEKDVWYNATVNWLGDGKINWTDGTDDLQANVGANAVMTNQLRLFSRCNSSNSTYNNCKSRVRKLQFSDGSEIIRDYVPVVWHNGNTTAIATLYDKVYNKMLTPSGSLKAYIEKSTFSQLRSYTENNTHGYYISATGVVTAQGESDYSGAIPVKQGDVITLTVTTGSTNSNKRIHGYTTTNTNSWVQQLGVIAYAEAGEPTRTVSVTVPSGVNYIRISHSIYGETQCDLTIMTTYEVGSNCSVQTATSNYFDSGLYGNEKWNVRLLVFTPTNTTGQLFGVARGADYTENLTINSAGATGGGSLSRFDSKVTTQNDVIHMGANEKSLLQSCAYGLWQDSTQVMAWSNPDTFTTLQTCHICKVNGSTGIRPNGCCYLAIEEDNVLIAEYIPVRNKTVTSSYGLYDRVSRTLNTGIGTITFNGLS